MPIRLLIIPLLASLAACAEPTTTERFPDKFGEAVRANMAAQIIAEEGEVQTLAPAPGPRRSLAVSRYQTDRVETPTSVYTIDE